MNAERLMTRNVRSCSFTETPEQQRVSCGNLTLAASSTAMSKELSV